MEEMSRCFRENEAFREFAVEMVLDSGDVTPGEAEAAVALFANEEIFELSFVDAAEDDPNFALLLSMLGSMTGELCPSDLQSSHSEGGESGVPGGVGVVDSEMEEYAGDLFDCLQENDEFAEDFWSGSDGVDGTLMFEFMGSDRELFVEVFSGAAMDDDVELWVRMMLYVNCR